MDTITHGLVGALLARAAAGENARPAVAVATAAAVLPDIDAFFVPGSWFHLADRLGYIEYHRGPTHSFVMAPLFALLVAGAARLLARRQSLRRLWSFAFLGILSHIFLDWITSYGTMFFSPVSWRRYSLDWVFIIDPWFTGIALMGLLAALALRRRNAARGAAAVGSAILAGYVGFCAVQHARALGAARRAFPGARVAALPQPFSPFRWAIFGVRQAAVELAYVDVGPWAPAGPAPEPRRPARSLGEAIRRLSGAYAAPGSETVVGFPTRREDRFVLRARGFRDVAAWLAFARFPVAEIEPIGNGAARVTLTDLRFRGPWRRTAFRFEAVIGADGSELGSGFVRGPS
jgi:inner membrane protein